MRLHFRSPRSLHKSKGHPLNSALIQRRRERHSTPSTPGSEYKPLKVCVSPCRFTTGRSNLIWIILKNLTAGMGWEYFQVHPNEEAEFCGPVDGANLSINPSWPDRLKWNQFLHFVCAWPGHDKSSKETYLNCIKWWWGRIWDQPESSLGDLELIARHQRLLDEVAAEKAERT
jgi:hypothetical protein